MPGPNAFVEPLIEHGFKPTYAHVDEEGLLVLSCDWSPERDEVTRKGENRAVEYSRWEDPRLVGELQGRPRRNAMGQTFGLGNVHPGVAVDLLNVAAQSNIHGFTITADSSTIIGNPKRSSNDEGVTVTVPFTYRPFVLSAAGLAKAAGA